MQPSSIVKDLRLFHQDVRAQLYVLVGLVLVAVMTEGVAMAFLLPLLSNDNDDNPLVALTLLLLRVFSLERTTANLLIMLVAFLLVRTGFLFWQASYSARLVSNYLANLRIRLLRRIEKAEPEYVLTMPGGYYVNLLTRELEQVRFGLEMLVSLLVGAIMAITYLVLPMIYDPVATTIILAMVVPVALLASKVSGTVKSISIETSQYSERFQILASQVMNYLRYFKATNSFSSAISPLERIIRHLADKNYLLKRLAAQSEYSVEPLVVIVLATVIYIFVELRGQSLTDLVFLLLLLRMALVRLAGLQPAYRKYLGAAGSLAAYHAATEALDSHSETPGSVVVPRALGDIEFRNVCFAYPGGTGNRLDCINLTIPAKKTTALVGRSGAGKSTLTYLVCGMLQPSKGDVLLGGVPYKELMLSDLRRRIGYVPQELPIFHDSHTANLTLWSENVDYERLSDLIEKSGLSAALLGRGAQSLGRYSTELSGGEKQRLCLARELYRNTDILVLDEATAALDAETESSIEELISSESHQRTLIVIAHRLATVRRADIIHVMENGRIVESGNFDELLKANGHFRRMVELQQL